MHCRSWMRTIRCCRIFGMSRLGASRTTAIGGGGVRRSCIPGGHNSPAPQFSRPVCRSNRRLALVHGSAHLRVRAGLLHVLRLSGYGRDVPLVRSRFFLWRGTRGDAAIAAVVADSVDCGVVNHLSVVNVVNVSDIDVHHRTVVKEMSAVPSSTYEAY